MKFSPKCYKKKLCSGIILDGHLQLLPAFLYSLYLTLYKTDISPKVSVLIVGQQLPTLLDVTCCVRAIQRYNIVTTLFRIVTTSFQHCNAVLHKKSSLRIVPCNITLRLRENGRKNSQHCCSIRFARSLTFDIL